MIRELYQHKDFTIVSKPEGLSCHNDNESLLQKYGKDWHLVNRIDRETSGLVVLTRNSILQHDIQNALAQGKKTYFAVLRGNMPQNPDLWHEWTYPISDKGEGRELPQGLVQDQKQSKTRYRVLQSNPYFSAVECLLITGRQHQIRKHSRLGDRPIVGDTRYGNPKDNQRIAKMYGFQRMALHAWKTEFTWSGDKIFVEDSVPKTFFDLFSLAKQD
ncbi:MAG: RNA pseudouridine synthase [Bdellovibrionaceae bacterium]|nr:RNA pseudouridine synthase [Pseudobdellovibrionaceae bacterium]